MTVILQKDMQSKINSSGFMPFCCMLEDTGLNVFINSQPLQTLRELGMLKVMEDITDIPEWYRKVGF